MYKYNFTYHDWLGPLHVILKKIEYYNNIDICTATAFRELCEERDECKISDVHTQHTKHFIDRLCTVCSVYRLTVFIILSCLTKI